MAIETFNYNGKEELTMAQFESLLTLEDNTDYDIIDYPDTSITNDQMKFALTCQKLFPTGTTFICSDDGDYKQNHTYIMKGTPKQWVDITVDVENKLDKTGGIITGNLGITGNLTVDGTTITKDTETLKVKDNIIVTNSEGIELVKLSGLGIRKNSTDTYGIAYEPSSDSVKLGLGKLDTNNEFTFNENEGKPLAIRSNNTDLTNNHLIKWDSSTNTLIDSGRSADDFDGKLNRLSESEANRVYVRTTNGTDTSLPYSYTAEADTIAKRSASGTLAVETPTQENDATNKKYVDNQSQKYLSLTGESGTLDESQYALVTGYDNLIIQRVGLDFRRSGYPTNSSGDYVFLCDYYAKPNGTEEWADYIITIKTDKTWTSTIKNHISVGEQTYPSVVELTPASAINGTLSDDNFNYLTNYDDVKIKLNNEYYILMDDGHTEGIVSYIHEGWNGSGNQVKSINITKSTKAWTLVVGETQYYRHYIQLMVGDKKVYYDFSSTKSTAYTSATLPVMPDDSINAMQIIYNTYYSSVSGLVYRNSEGDLKVIIHGMYTTDGTNFSYLTINGDNATFISDTVSKL